MFDGKNMALFQILIINIINRYFEFILSLPQ